jgi:hypothetical protein
VDRGEDGRASDEVVRRPQGTLAERAEGKASWRDDERIIAWWSDEKRLGKVQDITRITREQVDDIILRDREGVQPNAKPDEHLQPTIRRTITSPSWARC